MYIRGYNIIHIPAKGKKEILSTQRNAIKTFARNMLVVTARAWEISRILLEQYGLGLDIIYEDSQLPVEENTPEFS